MDVIVSCRFYILRSSVSERGQTSCYLFRLLWLVGVRVSNETGGVNKEC